MKVLATHLPIFPLSSFPTCRHCHTSKNNALCTVQPDNDNNNAGRPYYICSSCHPWIATINGIRTPSSTRWITWNDSIGVEAGNPTCYCGLASRRDQAGEDSKVLRKGEWFWACARGVCGYFYNTKQLAWRLNPGERQDMVAPIAHNQVLDLESFGEERVLDLADVRYWQ